jgi:hypothetical protein
VRLGIGLKTPHYHNQVNENLNLIIELSFFSIELAFFILLSVSHILSFGLVFTKTGSINSGNVLREAPLRKSLHVHYICTVNTTGGVGAERNGLFSICYIIDYCISQHLVTSVLV